MPTKPRSAALSMRIAPSTRDELVERAKASGRSVTQEADRLLQQSLLITRMMGSGLRPMIEVMMAFDRAGAYRADELQINGDWSENFECYSAALSAALRRLFEMAPNWDGNLLKTIADQALLAAQQRRTGQTGSFIPAEGEDK